MTCDLTKAQSQDLSSALLSWNYSPNTVDGYLAGIEDWRPAVCDPLARCQQEEPEQRIQCPGLPTPIETLSLATQDEVSHLEHSDADFLIFPWVRPDRIQLSRRGFFHCITDSSSTTRSLGRHHGLDPLRDRCPVLALRHAGRAAGLWVVLMSRWSWKNV